MELDEFHVHQVGAGLHRQRVTVAGVLPGVGGDLVGLADAAGREDHGGGVELHEGARLAPVRISPGDPVAGLALFGEQLQDRALHEDVDPRGDGLVLKGPDHLQAGAVTDVSETSEAVTAEVTLQDPAIGCAVKDRSPLLELHDPVGGFLGVQLSHPPVVEHLSATHRVAEMNLPVVVFPDVAHGGGDAALSHDRVGLAEQALADDGRLGATFVGLDGGPQTRSTGTDDDDVVVVDLSGSRVNRRGVHG